MTRQPGHSCAVAGLFRAWWRSLRELWHSLWSADLQEYDFREWEKEFRRRT